MPSHADGTWFTEARARRFGWLFITLAVLVVYWPLSTFQYATDGGDTFDCWLPWRHFITLALKNGELPLWNPLQQMGYPVYADLQGPAWYPEAIAIGGTLGHSMWSLQALFLLYVILGGIGFMRLCQVVHGDARIGAVTGLAYALSGFLVSHQMHFYSIISAAWMPWFLAAQLKLMRAPRWRTALEAAVWMMLLLTGGNHTFTIIAAYLLLPLLVMSAVQAWRRQGPGATARLLAHQLLFAGSTLVLACGTFYAWIEVSPYLGRMHGLPYSLSSEGPANLMTLPTLLFPALFGKNDWELGTHPAMANTYMGAVMLGLACIAVIRRRSSTENVLAVFGLCCLLLALANDLPFHRLAWRWLPGLNVFRFPSYYLYFTLLAVLLLAAGSLKSDAAWRWGTRRSLLLGLGCVLLVGTALLLFSPERLPIGTDGTLRRSLFEWVRALSYKQRMLLAWAVTAPVLVLWLLLLRRGQPAPSTVLILTFLEMGWNTHLAVWNSSVSDVHPAVIAAGIAPQAAGPLLPDLLPLAAHDDKGGALPHLWRNTETFLGRPVRDGFNSFWPTHTDSLLNQFADLAGSMDRQPMVYLTDHVHPTSALGHAATDSSMAFVQGPPLPSLRMSPGDTVAFTHFDYDHFKLRTRTIAPTFLLVQQTWFPGWSIRVDDRPAELRRANVAAFGALLDPGEHAVEVRFEKPAARWLMGISMTAFVLALFVLAAAGTGLQRVMGLSASAMMGCMIAWSLLAHQRTTRTPASHSERTPRAHDPRDQLVFSQDAGIAWRLHPGNEFTPAFNTRVSELRRSGQRSLAISFSFEPRGRCSASLVFHRTLAGRTLDYQAEPFVVRDSISQGPHQWSEVRDLREWRYPEEELRIYVWNHGPDTMVVRDLRVITSPRWTWCE